MTDQPSRITPADISTWLDQVSGLTAASPLADQIAYHQRKAWLLHHLANSLATAEAHLTAAGAWHQLHTLYAQRDQQAQMEVTP